MPVLFVAELAAAFWSLAGRPGLFPRDLQRALALALPVAVVELPGLRLAALADWLARHGAACPLGGPDRPLRAGLVARAGRGLVFLDGTDPDDERRFSLAHETAHFLADYWWPRRQAERRLGPAALEVLDSQRRPTPAERVDAALAGLALGPHVHLMERTPSGHPAGSARGAAEQAADALALELLAPEAEAGPIARAAASDQEAATELAARFGLPPAVARAYAQTLRPAEGEGAALLRMLGLGRPANVSHFRPSWRNRG